MTSELAALEFLKDCCFFYTFSWLLLIRYLRVMKTCKIPVFLLVQISARFDH